ncbi:MAG: S1 RNA-binding domain-containing protein, partial [Deltaproteobacteria bacterium]|nr:S1 RNA-binding domain-containing protein [Deltaproteobacteria bacterium]
MGEQTDKTQEPTEAQEERAEETRDTDRVESRVKAGDDREGAKSEQDKNFLELYEESLKSIQEGGLVRGEIVHVDKEFVLVDIGYKSEGQIPIGEFIDSNGQVTARVGDEVDVILERREDDEGIIILSKEKAAKIKIWDEIRDVYEKGLTIKGKVTARVKGGMSVDIGLPAFLPGSQISLKPIKDFDSLIGTVHEFKILK